MSRAWIEFVSGITDRVPLPVLLLLLFGLAAAVAALWYWFPKWVPRRMPRFGRIRWRGWSWRWPRLRWPHLRWPRWRRPRWGLRWPGWAALFWWLRRRRRTAEAVEPEPLVEPEAGDALPDVPAEALADLADRLAAEGRYAEAVRERLRAIVRDLVDRGVIDHRPGWTVTELARAAAATRPAVDAPLTEAGRVFSDIWYGSRPAHAGHDARMRELVADVHRALVPVGASS
jgi:hypothetical protein